MTIKIWKWRYLLYVRAACRRQTLRIASFPVGVRWATPTRPRLICRLFYTVNS
ncbi:hypothetical protein [Nostoc sp. PCC 9305]|uniref:hypothetical protein n=1 Tax=Nostoc sp. PCC 9305 TaxID=296636 RepID=UPI0039C5D42A